MTGVNPLERYLDNGKISLSDLKQITKDFSGERLLGEGAMGAVYKGTLENGELVAVKRHSDVTVPEARDQTKYENTVRHLMKHEHVNVVKLLAFCRQEDTRDVKITKHIARQRQDIVETLLCYEYFHKGSLHKNLFGESVISLDWKKRFEIIKGICLGLESLHHAKPNGPILHLNLKSQNILLDDNDAPKITDFAYSRLFGEVKTTRITESSLGSRGYRAPEYANNGKHNQQISKRTDIYSLGLIILEITTHEKNSPGENEETAKHYIAGVKLNWANVHQHVMTQYPRLDENGREEVKTCIETGLKCVNSKHTDRPKIEDIVKTLGAKLKDEDLAPLQE